MILLDSCVLSEVLKVDPSPQVLEWLDCLPEERVYIPAIVIGEIRKGIELLASGNKKNALAIWLEQLQQRFSGRILSFDQETAIHWARLTGRLEKSGIRAPVMDSLIAATALQYNAILATRNIRDYENSDIHLIDPWSDCSSE